MRKAISFLVAGCIAGFGLVAPGPSQAQTRISFLRDAEIENTIRAYATPLFTAAGLDPQAIGVHLVIDSSLNAFVANGLNMFLNTGFLIRADNPGQVIGVLAHETGHITGGHMVRSRDAMRGAMAEMIVAMVVGIAAAAATGRGDAAMAGVAGGLTVGERSLLRYTREMESAADQAAVNLLERTGQSARGLAEFLSILSDQELVAAGRQDPYLRTHPITRERVDFVLNQLPKLRYSNAPDKPEFVEMHKRMRAKLQGYLEPQRALQVYRESDPSPEARYARAIAYSRRPDYPRALALMDSLLKERPKDPYYNEAKGQFLYEAGRPQEAVTLYEAASATLPDDPLIRFGLAQALLDTGRPEAIKKAIANLESARHRDPEAPEYPRLLSIAYGRDGQVAMANLSHAEYLAMVDRRAEARHFADRALRELPSGSAAWLRAQDIKATTERKP